MKVKKSKHGKLAATKTDILAGNRAASSLVDLIKLKTVSQPDELHAELEWSRMRDYLRARYPSLHMTANREIASAHSLLYTWNSDAPKGDPILICAHMDVVPADDEGWSHPPFAGETENGYIYGRGALDCKGPLVAIMEALETLCKSGYKPDRDIYIALGHDEETGGLQGARGMAKLFAARRLRFFSVLDEGGLVHPGLFGASRPAALVCVSEKGMAHLTLTAKAEGGHAAIPSYDSAVENICEAVCRLTYRGRKPQILPLIRESMQTLAGYMSFGKRLVWSYPGLFSRKARRHLQSEPPGDAVLRTTFSPVTLKAGIAHNVHPSESEALFSVRLLPGDAGETILQYCRDLTRDLGVESAIQVFSEGGEYSSRDSEAYLILRAAVKSIFGEIPVLPWIYPCSTDARHYEVFSDNVLRFAPFIVPSAEWARMHGVNERLEAELLGSAVAFYREYIKRATGGIV